MTDQKTLGEWIKIGLSDPAVKSTPIYYISRKNNNTYICCLLGAASIGKRKANNNPNALENAHAGYRHTVDSGGETIDYFSEDLNIDRNIALRIIWHTLNPKQDERLSSDKIIELLKNDQLLTFVLTKT